jgi:nucleotide-binding universal stress UspA family protein
VVGAGCGTVLALYGFQKDQSHLVIVCHQERSGYAEEGLMSEKMKLLIAYDGSSCADAALDDLRHAGLPHAAEALIMCVADVFLPPPSSAEPAVPAQVIATVQQARAQAAHAMEEAHALALQARAQVLAAFPDWDVGVEACADSPAWGLIKKVDTWQPDLVVVGSHGRSAIGRLFAWQRITQDPRRGPVLSARGA